VDQLCEAGAATDTSAPPVGQVSGARGHLAAERFLPALGEAHGLKVGKRREVTPQPEALQLVPETRTKVYKMVSRAFKDQVLTSARGDPNNLAAGDGLRNLLHSSAVPAQRTTPPASAEATTPVATGQAESSSDSIQEIAHDPESGQRQAETSSDREDRLATAQAAPVRQLINMVFLWAVKDHASAS